MVGALSFELALLPVTGIYAISVEQILRWCGNESNSREPGIGK